MGFAINTNNDALNTYRNLNNVQNSLSKSLERLSSGLRINQAGDDAAGLTISTTLGSQVSGLQQASRNAQDGVSLVQTADGSLSQAQTILGRLRDLAVQSGNDSNSKEARDAIQAEATTLTDELTRLSTSVNFNGTKLLDGSAKALTFQIGANGDSQSQIGVDLSKADLGAVAKALGSQSVGTFKVTAASLAKGDYTFAAGSTTVKVTLSADPDSAASLATALSKDAGFSNAFTATASADGNSLIVSSKSGETVSDATAPGAGVAKADVTTGAIAFDSAASAKLAIAAIDVQIKTISGARAQIGALENRFASAVSTIATSVTNLTAAKSRITDVDMAQEMVSYTRANVLSQSGTAMLAQANSLPQLALKLLG